MKRNGILHITANAGARYRASWTPSGSPGGGRPHRPLADEARLREFLRLLGIGEEHTRETLERLHDATSGANIHSIPEVWLSEEDARTHGLA